MRRIGDNGRSANCPLRENYDVSFQGLNGNIEVFSEACNYNIMVF